MDGADVVFLAKYPFLRRSRDFVSSLDMPLDALLAHPVYCAALELGRRRVLDCMEGSFKPAFDEPIKAQLTVLSYPLGRMMAMTLGKAAAGKYATGEAQAAFESFKGDPEAASVIALDLGVSLKEGKMPFIQFVSLSSGLARHQARWKLVNRRLEAGQVEVEESDAMVLLREAVRVRVLEHLDMKKVPDEVKAAAGALRVMLSGEKSTLSIEALENDALPPCMRGLVAAMEGGVASHNAMFILATFLSNLGLGADDLVKVFSKSPKFDEEKTRYQLGFLTGQSGGTEYTCPTCATIKSHGLCKAECRVKHPLQYYRRNAKRKPATKPPQKKQAK